MKRKTKTKECDPVDTEWAFALSPCNVCGSKPKFMFWHKTGTLTLSCECSDRELDSSVMQGDGIKRCVIDYNRAILRSKWTEKAKRNYRFDTQPYFLVESVLSRITQRLSSVEEALRVAQKTNSINVRCQPYKMENDTPISIELNAGSEN